MGERGEVVCGILEFGRGGVDFILFSQDANNPVIGNLFPLLGELPLGKFYMFKFGFWVTCPTSCNVESQLSYLRTTSNGRGCIPRGREVTISSLLDVSGKEGIAKSSPLSGAHDITIENLRYRNAKQDEW